MYSCCLKSFLEKTIHITYYTSRSEYKMFHNLHVFREQKAQCGCLYISSLYHNFINCICKNNIKQNNLYKYLLLWYHTGIRMHTSHSHIQHTHTHTHTHTHAHLSWSRKCRSHSQNSKCRECSAEV